MYFHITIFPLNSSIKVAYWNGAKMSTKHRLCSNYPLMWSASRRLSWLSFFKKMSSLMQTISNSPPVHGSCKWIRRNFEKSLRSEKIFKHNTMFFRSNKKHSPKSSSMKNVWTLEHSICDPYTCYQNLLYKRVEKSWRIIKKSKIACWLDTAPNLRYTYLIKINRPGYNFNHWTPFQSQK